MNEGGAHDPHAASTARMFRCKVLKPPRWVDTTPETRVVTHPPIDVVAGVIRREDGRILITQRLADDTLGGYWEFPGGKVDPGEELRAALTRELREELGIETEVGAEIHQIVHAYPDRDVRLYFYETRIISGEPQKLEVADLRWVTLDELGEHQFPEADRPLLQQLRCSGGL
ncbi:MAG TPA: 8-oxo-dGTP diphosphatase MutT [Candidatus Methylacidiphilales bacterium]|jgi:8-oxo-dGTP diphosphatase|nr:8-oxo-dGTP diphosphatase MutT [Candidatus Methylacidiphilales bacterium]